MTTVATRKWTGAPFGVQRPRFGSDGVHPRNRLPGTYIGSDTSPELGPGKYELDYGGFSAKAVAERAKGPGWARKYEVEHATAIPYLLNKEYWQSKRDAHRIRGPGSYNIGIKYDKSASTRGILDQREPRFVHHVDHFPGPGTYGYPDQQLVEKAKRSASNVGMLSGGVGERHFPTVGCHLGPGQYRVPNDGTIDALLSKRCSVRGPYDLFTDERDAPLIAGHFATIRKYNLGPGQYECKSFIEDMNSPDLKKHGKFATVTRFPRKPVDRVFFTLAQHPREPSEPGPGQYHETDHTKRSLTQGDISALPPFLSSTRRDDATSVKFFTGNHNPVGVGRYDIPKFHESQDINGHESNFVSKTGRPTILQIKVFNERYKPKHNAAERGRACFKSDKPESWFDMDKSRIRKSCSAVDVRRPVAAD